MDAELAMVLGIVLVGFSIPAILSSLSDGRRPIVPIVIILIAGGFIFYAINIKPGGFAFADLPEAFIHVIARFMP